MITGRAAQARRRPSTRLRRPDQDGRDRGEFEGSPTRARGLGDHQVVLDRFVLAGMRCVITAILARSHSIRA